LTELDGFAFEPERSPEWAGYLSDEQFEAVDAIFQALVSNPTFQFHLVLGVAGTGKTQVLLSLAEDLRESGIGVIFGFSDHLKQYLASCGVSTKSDKTEPGVVYLLDDPTTLRKMKQEFQHALDIKARAIVIAIDPFQFQERKALLKFAHYLHPEMNSEEFRTKSNLVKEVYKDVIYTTSPHIHWLKTIYRQQANVGRQVLELTKEVFSKTNPFILEERKNEWKSIIGSQLAGAFEDLRFATDGGFVKIIESANPEQDLISCIADHYRKPGRWDWVKSFLVVTTDLYSRFQYIVPTYNPEHMPRIAKRQSSHDSLNTHLEAPVDHLSDGLGKEVRPGLNIREITRAYNGEICEYSKANLVRGKEYQEVFVVMTRKRYDFIRSQKQGITTEIWKEIIPLHTFTTRAKSQVTILLTQ
jgi:hypothetical protein